MPTFALRDADLDFDVSGTDGPAVVQLHGLTSSRRRDSQLRLNLTRALLPPQARVLRYDARGHGRSTGRDAADDFDWSHLASDLLSLLDHVFPGESVHGVGPSMGTGTLLHAAVRDEPRFAGLVLAIPPTAWDSRHAQARLYADQAELVASDGLDAFIAAGRRAPRPPATADTPDTVPDVTEALLPTVMRGAAQSDLPPPSAIGALQVPSLVLAWDDDPSHPLSTARSLHQLLTGSSLTMASSPEQVLTWPDAVAAFVTSSRS